MQTRSNMAVPLHYVGVFCSATDLSNCHFTVGFQRFFLLLRLINEPTAHLILGYWSLQTYYHSMSQPLKLKLKVYYLLIKCFQIHHQTSSMVPCYRIHMIKKLRTIRLILKFTLYIYLHSCLTYCIDIFGEHWYQKKLVSSIYVTYRLT